MYMTLDALADGGVYAGVPKEKAINLIAHTMMVRHCQEYIGCLRDISKLLHITFSLRDQLRWFLKMDSMHNR